MRKRIYNHNTMVFEQKRKRWWERMDNRKKSWIQSGNYVYWSPDNMMPMLFKPSDFNMTNEEFINEMNRMFNEKTDYEKFKHIIEHEANYWPYKRGKTYIVGHKKKVRKKNIYHKGIHIIMDCNKLYRIKYGMKDEE